MEPDVIDQSGSTRTFVVVGMLLQILKMVADIARDTDVYRIKRIVGTTVKRGERERVEEAQMLFRG